MSDSDHWAGIVSPEILTRLAEMSQEFAASGREPATPRPAATVVLLRADRAVFMMRRLRGMAFGGMWAFPGGSLEPGETPEAGAVRELAEETGVRVAPGSLTPWHRWVTPIFEPRRFDTWFYLAALPEGEQPQLPSAEADEARWFTLDDALAGASAGDLPMLPPTLITLRELADYDSVTEMLAAERDISEPYLPNF